jgi:RND family efflux transporter MFP subunit
MKLNRTKLIVLAAGMLFALGVGAFLTLRSGHHHGPSVAKEETLYTCGMHPLVIQKKPGNCPICGMKLTPIRKQPSAAPASDSINAPTVAGERKIKYYKSTMLLGEISPTPRKDSMGMEMVPVYEDEAADSATIFIDPVTTQNMGIRTGVVTKGPLRRTIRTVGVIDFDETALADVTTKFRGWIETLYADATGKQVHRGEPLFEIYSPELYSAQVEFLLALEQAARVTPGSDSLKASALTKLRFFDVSDEQIAELEKTKQARKALRVNAPRDGVVVEKMVVQGQMVDAGLRLYRLADLSLVWVLSQVYEQDLAFLKLGQEAVMRLSYLPDREFRGRVTYIYPTLDEKTRTAKVRMEFHNPGFFLKPGMFATVELRAELESSTLLVPDMAVLRSGEKNTVFVALDGGKFEPRTVTLGPRAENNLYQVLSGLNEGEHVVTSGQFMLDSESQLREAIQKMLKPVAPQREERGASERESVQPSSTLHAAHPPRSTAYICPMPEHVAIKYERPGKCPICGMTLVPVSEAALAKLQPGGRVQHYTCPMPEHSDVKLDKPGKCPQCGMTLIPVMEPPPIREERRERGTSERESGGATSTLHTQHGPLSTTLYTCPMASHVDVVSDKPGKCPKCEMDLVPTTTVKHGKTAEENWRKQQAAKFPADAAKSEHQH